MGFSKSSAKGKVHSNTSVSQETREMKNPRVSRRKEIIKIRAEINEKEIKETIAKINKLKAGSLSR